MNKKEIIKTVSIITLIIIILLLVIPQEYERVSQENFLNGYNEGQNSIIVEQSRTGNMFLINDNSVEQYSLRDLCSLGGQNG